VSVRTLQIWEQGRREPEGSAKEALGESAVPYLYVSKNSLGVTNVKTYAFLMKTISATVARSDLYRVIDSTIEEHEPIQITGKRGNVILVSEPDWRAIQETLYLVSMPGMRDSIRAGMAESIGNCSKEVDL
jgi:antitoxin YefM